MNYFHAKFKLSFILVFIKLLNKAKRLQHLTYHKQRAGGRTFFFLPFTFWRLIFQICILLLKTKQVDIALVDVTNIFVVL